MLIIIMIYNYSYQSKLSLTVINSKIRFFRKINNFMSTVKQLILEIKKNREINGNLCSKISQLQDNQIQELLKNIINGATSQDRQSFFEKINKISNTELFAQIMREMLVLNLNNQFNEGSKGDIKQYFPGICDVDPGQAETLAIPSDHQTLTYFQVDVVLKILSMVFNKQFSEPSFNQHKILFNDDECVAFSGQLVIRSSDTHILTKCIQNAAWDILLKCLEKQQAAGYEDLKFPKTITLIHNVNLGPGHWTSAVTKIVFDQNKLPNSAIIAAMEIARNHSLDKDNGDSHINTEVLGGISLPAAKITTYHYNSCNSAGDKDKEGDIIKNCPVSNDNHEFEFKPQQCGQQVNLECGDWTAVHGFLAGVVGETELKNKVTNITNHSLRSLTKECVQLYMNMEANHSMTPEEKYNMVVNKALAKDSEINKFFQNIDYGDKVLSIASIANQPSSSSDPTLGLRHSAHAVLGGAKIDPGIILDNPDKSSLVSTGQLRKENIPDDDAGNKGMQRVTQTEIQDNNTQGQLVVVPANKVLMKTVPNDRDTMIQCPINGTLSNDGSDNQHLLLSQIDYFITSLFFFRDRNHPPASDVATVEISGFNKDDLCYLLQQLAINEKGPQSVLSHNSKIQYQDLSKYIKLEVATKDINKYTEKDQQEINALLQEFNSPKTAPDATPVAPPRGSSGRRY